jgi:hypothetical protein
MTVTYTPRPDSLYGRLIAAVDVAEALRARIAARIDGYLDEVERQHGLVPGAIARPRALVIGPERFPEDQLPAIVIRSPGTADLPLADGQGRYAARFELELELGVAVGAGAFELASLYALALRALVLQQPSPLFMGVDWTRERFDEPTLIGARTYYAARVLLEVHVPDITDRHAGPPDEPGWPEPPPHDPESPEWPTVATADTDVLKVPIDAPVDEGGES